MEKHENCGQQGASFANKTDLVLKLALVAPQKRGASEQFAWNRASKFGGHQTPWIEFCSLRWGINCVLSVASHGHAAFSSVMNADRKSQVLMDATMAAAEKKEK